jgi:hypothetical protein
MLRVHETESGYDVLLQAERCCQLKLHLGSRVNHQCTGGVSIPRLSGCPRWVSWLDAVRPYRDIPPVHRNRRKFQTEWLRFARISTRRLSPAHRDDFIADKSDEVVASVGKKSWIETISLLTRGLI